MDRLGPGRQACCQGKLLQSPSLPTRPATGVQPQWRRWKRGLAGRRRAQDPPACCCGGSPRPAGLGGGCPLFCLYQDCGRGDHRAFQSWQVCPAESGYRPLCGPHGAVSLGVTWKPRPWGYRDLGVTIPSVCPSCMEGAEPRCLHEPQAGQVYT